MLTQDIITARQTFNYAADRILIGLTPPERAAKTAITFREIGDVADALPLTPADMVAGFELLGTQLAAVEPGNVTGLRNTCREVAALLRPVPDGGDPQRLAAVFRRIETAFGGSVAARYRAIAETAGREAREIEAVRR